MTNELLDKYLKGFCTQEEKQQIADWLSQPDAADEVLLSRWNAVTEAMPDTETGLLWQRLSQQLSWEQKNAAATRARIITVWARRLSVAAVWLLVAAAALLWFTQKPVKKEVAALGRADNTSKEVAARWVRLTNEKQANKRIVLDDSSVVILEKGASIRYLQGFEAGQRKIWLNGTAFFEAAPDKQRPFSVQAGDIVTTAIGTSFTINYNGTQTPLLVQLHEGKVKVYKVTDDRHMNEVYLNPGQQCSYMNGAGQLLVSKFSRLKPATAAPSTETVQVDVMADTLLFENRPLETVLSQLRQRYHAAIRYNKREISDIYFSGKVVKADSLEMVLRVIAQMNALELDQKNGVYILSK